jgi:hypothetical protein
MKRKVEDGHCHNAKHDHRDRNSRLCVKGSEFHKKLYDESSKSFEDSRNDFQYPNLLARFLDFCQFVGTSN